MAAGDAPNWDGLLKWSIAHSDGTRPNRNPSEEDRRWFMEAMQAQTVDVVKRMKEITLVMKTPDEVLESHGVTPADIQDMLDELQEHVESIDMANDLHSIGGLAPLLGYLRNTNAGIRAKAAEVVTTIVQNNPLSQQLVMDASGLEPLLSCFTVDPDVTVRTKALGAISSLIRNNKQGISAFRLANGYAALRDALGSENARFQRKALNLIQYLLHENNADCDVVAELGFPRQMMHLASSGDSDIREAALGCLLELARDPASGSSRKLAEEDKLRQVLSDRIEGISSMSSDELGAAKEERQLVDSLWNACYHEPSSLREKGLVVLPGEDAPQIPPDVAGKLFEPPLRAWAAAAQPPPVEGSKTEPKTKKESPYITTKLTSNPIAMASCRHKLPLLLLIALTASSLALAGDFNSDFDITWGDGRAKILDSGRSLTLSLDKSSGSGFQSKREYLFGRIDMQLKLVPGDSAGTVTTYYLSSQGPAHDEIDFEFLGNASGHPYTLHTNVFAQGKGNKEQQFRLWFDPTADFHTYSVLWNPRHVIFSVDGIPIRDFKKVDGVPFPEGQPMRIYSSLWNADDWATQGGRVKTDWSKAPFTASYRNFYADACVGSCSKGSSSPGWYNQELDSTREKRMAWARKNYMIYNYCADRNRFPQGVSKECSAAA